MTKMEIITRRTVRLNARAANKVEAIKEAGKSLVLSGYVAKEYVEDMLAREEIMSTYLGNGVAIPHGQFGKQSNIYRTGISVIQYPDGVQWSPTETAYLVIGIAAPSDDHIGVLANLAEILEEPGSVEELARTSDPSVIVDRLHVDPDREKP